MFFLRAFVAFVAQPCEVVQSVPIISTRPLRKLPWIVVVIGLLIGMASDAAAQKPPTVAAASSLNFALTAVADQFTRDRGERVNLVFGASGTLTRQIQEGAPFELFLAADEEFPDHLAKAGLTRDAGVVYALGRLVLFAPKGSPLVVDERLDGLTTLIASGGVRRFAIANPDVAPYGRAAEEVLRKRGLWDTLQASLVKGDSIAQAAQFATTGNAVGGLIAYSLVRNPDFAGRGTFVLVPSADHAPIRQKMVRLKSAGRVSDHFYQYLQGPEARAILERGGFEVPR
jgi:molybdate transport system substrate-binding protein